MTDLIKTVRSWLDAEDATHFGDFEKGVAAILDRLTAMKAAGDGLAGFAGHKDDCHEVLAAWGEVEACSCGYTEAWKQWKEASDGL